MKKKIIIVSIAFLIIFLFMSLIWVLLKFDSQKNVRASISIKEFSLNDYKKEMDSYSSNNVVNVINDADSAIEESKKLWLYEFNYSYNEQAAITPGMEIEVLYDHDEECWLVRCTISQPILASLPQSIIRKDGKVLAVWIG